MRTFSACWVPLIFALQAAALTAAENEEEVQFFLDHGWGFESTAAHGAATLCAARTNQIKEERAARFLGSLTGLQRLEIHFGTFAPGDILALSERCPGITSLEIQGSPELEASLWPEFFAFKELRYLSVSRLHFSGKETWPVLHVSKLDRLTLSGDHSGMLPVLLAFCTMRSLTVEYRPANQGEYRQAKQVLTAADHQAIAVHPEIESLAIGGTPLGTYIQLDLNALSKLNKLRELALEQCILDPGLLNQFPALQTLTLRRCQFFRHDFDVLAAHPALENVVLDDYSNADLRIAGPYGTPPKPLRSITVRSPILQEVGALANLALAYHVELCPGTCYASDKEARIVRRFGNDEVAMLEKLKGLRSVSVLGWMGMPPTISGTALLRLARIDTMRALRVFRTDIVDDVPRGEYQQALGLEEVRLVTREPLSQEFASRCLGGHTSEVFVGDSSRERQAEIRWGGEVHTPVETLGFKGRTFPISPSCLYGQLLSGSVKDLVLDDCKIEKGAVEQLVRTMPALEHITFHICSLKDEQELLRLNDLENLKSVDLALTDVSARTALSLKADRVRFGEWYFSWGMPAPQALPDSRGDSQPVRGESVAE